jgi:two-component system chemotaxis response regulator CheY
MKTILLVDDNPSYSSAWRDLCESLGCAVIETDSAQEAVVLLRRRPHIDLVMTDQCMRTMTGFELVRHMRSLEETRHIPILLLTNSGNALKDLLAQEGVTLLSKSVRPEEILRSIREALKMPNAMPSAPAAMMTEPHRIIQTSYEGFVPRERIVHPAPHAEAANRFDPNFIPHALRQMKKANEAERTAAPSVPHVPGSSLML